MVGEDRFLAGHAKFSSDDRSFDARGDRDQGREGPDQDRDRSLRSWGAEATIGRRGRLLDMAPKVPERAGKVRGSGIEASKFRSAAESVGVGDFRVRGAKRRAPRTPRSHGSHDRLLEGREWGSSGAPAASRAHNSAVECVLHTDEVAGSIPAAPTPVPKFFRTLGGIVAHFRPTSGPARTSAGRGGNTVPNPARRFSASRM